MGRLGAGRLRRDAVASTGSVLLFACSLSAGAIAIPLAMVEAGFSATDIGVLTAASAVTQFVTRAFMGRLMRMWSDWVLVMVACVLLGVSTGMVVFSAAWLWFALAQLLQGVARALFWTGSQTHVVRGSESSVKPLAAVNFTTNTGLLVGPALAGLLAERSVREALIVAAALAAVAAAPTFFLDRLPAFTAPPEGRQSGRIWRRPGVSAGAWAGVSAGAWRALINSYVLVVLVDAGHSSWVVGVLISIANLASLAGSAVVGRMRWRGLFWAFSLGIVFTGGGIAVLGVLAGSGVLAGAALALSGLGAGGIQTLGPAIAADAVHPEERGEAIAATGTFRAGALFVAPLMVAGVVTIFPVAAGLALAGAAMTLPALSARGLRSHLSALGAFDDRRSKGA